MRVFAVVTALSVLLAAAPTFAQVPAQTAPRPAAPSVQTPAPAPAAPANVPFPAGVKYGYVNLEQVFAGSAEGQRIQTLIQTKAKNSKSESHCSPSSYGIQPPATTTFDQSVASA